MDVRCDKDLSASKQKLSDSGMYSGVESFMSSRKRLQAFLTAYWPRSRQSTPPRPHQAPSAALFIRTGAKEQVDQWNIGNLAPFLQVTHDNGRFITVFDGGYAA